LGRQRTITSKEISATDARKLFISYMNMETVFLYTIYDFVILKFCHFLVRQHIFQNVHIIVHMIMVAVIGAS